MRDVEFPFEDYAPKPISRGALLKLWRKPTPIELAKMALRILVDIRIELSALRSEVSSVNRAYEEMTDALDREVQ